MVIEGWTWPVHHYSTSTDTRQDRSSDQVTLSSTQGWRSAGQVPIVFPCLVPPIPQCPVSSFQEWRPFRSFAAAASPSKCDVIIESWSSCSLAAGPAALLRSCPVTRCFLLRFPSGSPECAVHRNPRRSTYSETLKPPYLLWDAHRLSKNYLSTGAVSSAEARRCSFRQ